MTEKHLSNFKIPSSSKFLSESSSSLFFRERFQKIDERKMALRGKVSICFGVANARSIAWGVARAWADAGSRVHIVCQSERFVEKVKRMAESQRNIVGIHVCDVTDDSAISRLFENLAYADDNLRAGNSLNSLLHAVAHAPPSAMKEGTLLNTRREEFAAAHDVSAYSLIALAREAAPFMSRCDDTKGNSSSSITSLTYLGSTLAVPGYNVMGCAKASLEAVSRGLALELGPSCGIRVNCLSPGPVNTLAGRGIRNFVQMKNDSILRSPLGRTATLEEIGAAATFLASDGAASITGQVMFMDGGLSSISPI